MDPKVREYILKQLRTAVYLQIELWDAAASMAETLKWELNEVLSQVQQLSITADTGMELTEKDLDDFLGIEPEPASA